MTDAEMTEDERREQYIRSCMSHEQRLEYDRYRLEQQRQQRQQQQGPQQHHHHQHAQHSFEADTASGASGQPESSRMAVQQTNMLMMPRLSGVPVPARLLTTAAPVLSPRNATASDLDHRPEPHIEPIAQSAPQNVPPERTRWEHWPVI